MAQVAGQNAARETTRTSWPTSSIQNPSRRHQPQAGGDGGDRRAEQDAPAADAVRIGAADEVERRLREDRGGEQHADLGVRQALGIGVQRHRQPGHSEAEVPGERGEEKERVRHPRLWFARVRRRRAFRPMAMRLLLLFLLHRSGGGRSRRNAPPARGQAPPRWSSCIPPRAARAARPPTAGSSTLGSRYPGGNVVPLALHVDYWDYIGWKDPYAKREFSLRQRKFSQLQRMAFVYTPQVMLQGRDFRALGRQGLRRGAGEDQCPTGQGEAASSPSWVRTADALGGRSAWRSCSGRRARPTSTWRPTAAGSEPGEGRREPRPAPHP